MRFTVIGQVVHSQAKTIVEALDTAAARTDRGYTFLDNNQVPTDYSFGDLAVAAKRRGRQLMAMGLRKGDRLGLIVPENEDFVITFLGAVAVGIVPVPMYPPLALGKLDHFVDAAARILTTAGARAVVTNQKVSKILGTLLIKAPTLEMMVLTEKFENAKESDLPIEAVGPDDLCFLQFTSGSTADPKGVMVTHANLIANAKAIMVDGLRCDEQDRGVSWLPLYHDMGLIGFVIAPVCYTVPVVFIQTLSFVKRPTVWMATVDKYRGTITFAPNFAFALAAKRVRAFESKPIDLSCLRVVGCGAEPINAGTVRTFVDAYGKFGLNPNTIMPCYGMAEATLAMSFERLDEPMVTHSIRRDAYENEGRAIPDSGDTTLELVSCGWPLAEHDVAIFDETGKPLQDGTVGQLAFRGPSVTVGYYENLQATQATIVDGWLRTGDLGFLHEGRVYVSGRMKDLIILNGRNYHPQAIEWEVEQIRGVRKGNIVAFSSAGDKTERLVVVAESKIENKVELAQTIKSTVRSALGLVVDEALIIPAGALPKTSSGKLQRRKTKTMFEDGSLGREGVRTLGSRATKRTIARHVATSLFARVRHRVRQLRASIDLPIPGVSTREEKR